MEELLNRYRSFSLVARCGMLAALGLAPAAWSYLDESRILDEEITMKTSELDAAKARFEGMRKQANKLGDLEEQLAFTEAQMEEARKRLPDDFRVEDFLAKLATFATVNQALMTEFVPAQKVETVGTTYKYEELPINVKFEGAFEQVVSFLDAISHLQTMVHIRDINMTGTATSAIKKGQAEPQPATANVPADAALAAKKDKNGEAIEARASSFVAGNATVVIFRSAKSQAGAMAGPLPDLPPEPMTEPEGEGEAPAE